MGKRNRHRTPRSTRQQAAPTPKSDVASRAPPPKRAAPPPARIPLGGLAPSPLVNASQRTYAEVVSTPTKGAAARSGEASSPAIGTTSLSATTTPCAVPNRDVFRHDIMAQMPRGRIVFQESESTPASLDEFSSQVNRLETEAAIPRVAPPEPKLSKLEEDIKQKQISNESMTIICNALTILFEQNAAKLKSTPGAKAEKHAKAQVITLNRKHGSRIMPGMTIMKIMKPRRKSGDHRNRKQKGQMAIVDVLLNELRLQDKEERLWIAQALLAPFNAKVLLPDQCKLSVDHCIALMYWMPGSGRAVERLKQFFETILPCIGRDMFPKQLRPALAKYSSAAFKLEIGWEMVSLERTGNNGKGKCLFAWLKHPAMAIERLVNSAFVAGKFEESIDICTDRNKLLVVQGSDKGGDFTSCLVRVANRKDGNNSTYCIPLGFYEDGKETYENVEKTTFSQTKPIVHFLDTLLQDRCWLISVIASKSETVEGKTITICIDSQSELIQPFRCEQSAFSVSRSLPDQTQSELEPKVRVRTELPPKVDRNVGSNPTWTIETASKLSLGLVRKGDVYIGYKLLNGYGDLVHQNRFTEELMCGDTIDIKLVQVECQTADDGKFNSSVMGQGTCRTLCPCTICMEPKGEFGKNLLADKPSVLRTGEYANPKLYDFFLEAAGDDLEHMQSTSSGKARELKLACGSVTRKPLLYTPPNRNTGSIMHVSSGLVTHLTTQTILKLQEIDKTTEWFQNLAPKFQAAKKLSKKLTSEMTGLRAKVKKLQSDFDMAKQMNANTTAAIEKELDPLKQRLRLANQLSESTKLFVEKGSEFLEAVKMKNKKRVIGPASYAFRMAVEVYGRVSFRNENSGVELTNGDSIKAMERCSTIAARVKLVFSNDQQRQDKVDAVMQDYEKLGTTLYPIIVAMKSQDKAMEAC